MKSIINGSCLSAWLLLLACGSAEQGAGAEPAAVQQTLSVVGACTFVACGSMPPSLATTPSVECVASAEASSDSCAWSTSDDGSVSYRPCAASECPVAPAIDCPAGTLRSSQQCGSENDAACAWTTVCTPPRDTAPCPEIDGCGPQPALGVICDDGSNGELACVTNGQTCSWQPNCD
ncbi:MAG TPA: hypothetical protein VIW29_04640 [Polyangiaceae bacterium]